MRKVMVHSPRSKQGILDSGRILQSCVSYVHNWNIRMTDNTNRPPLWLITPTDHRCVASWTAQLQSKCKRPRHQTDTEKDCFEWAAECDNCQTSNTRKCTTMHSCITKFQTGRYCDYWYHWQLWVVMSSPNYYIINNLCGNTMKCDSLQLGKHSTTSEIYWWRLSIWQPKHFCKFPFTAQRCLTR